MHFYFIGVTTAQSAMTRILPMWAQAWGLELDLIGIDLPINASSALYQNAILNFKKDPKAIGAVVTTHKLNLFKHASHLFDDFDQLSKLTKEICVITNKDSKLIGLANPDCLQNTLGLKNVLASDHWHQYKSDVLCFGAGGVASSIALSLLYDFESASPLNHKRISTPRKILLVDIDQEQLQSIASLLNPLKGSVEIQYIHQSNASDNDQLVANLPKGSLIINATGMGKDLSGSPLTEKASFPQQSIIWDLNYRGERLFLQQAKSQEIAQNLNIHDDWLCFLYGWTQAIGLALGQTFSQQQFLQLAKIAETFRIPNSIIN